MYESKHSRNKRLFTKRSSMFGVNEGHTIFCDQECSFTHHEMLLSLVLCKRNDQKSTEKFKECVRRELASGWNRNSDIPDKAEFFRFPLLHWAAVYGKLFALQWLIDQDFDVEVTNTQGETALHRLIACQAHERAVDPRIGRGRRYSLGNIVQVFSKVLDILTSKCPQLILRYDYAERNTPLALCIKLLLENHGQCQRLVLYFQALFKVLCERLVNLVKQGKLSKEFVRNGFSLKDLNGNTIWHLAASCQNETVTSSFNFVMEAVEEFELSISNSKYETPILVALQNNNQEFAALIEAYKFSSASVPNVKMEMLSDSERDECCCEHQNNTSRQNNTEQDASLQESVDKCDGSCVINTSDIILATGVNTSAVQEEQTFTEPAKNVTFVEQEVVLTKPDQNDSLQPSENSDTKMEVDDQNNSVNGDLDSINESCDQEQIVIEKQIDLCLNVSQSTESSDLTTTDENTTCDLQTESDSNELQKPESSSAENNSESSNILAEALRQADLNANEVFVERIDPKSVNQDAQLLTPPDSSTSPDLADRNTHMNEPHTPPPSENPALKGISVTPVLLIKLLSEPDVSERFQSLLKDVITDDTAKVDSTQTTLQQLKTSRLNLECEISSSEGIVNAIDSKKENLNKEIARLQQEISDLEASEEMTRTKLLQLKKEQDEVTEKIDECESTCFRLKRRLSDCTGALIGMSPKSRKKC